MADHPITPPQEVVNQWRSEAPVARDGGATREQWIATQAARWGADQELEACCEWVSLRCGRWPDGTRPEDELRAAMRPKPLSIAEQAVQELDDAVMRGDCIATTDATPALRKALARLAELEALSDD